MHLWLVTKTVLLGCQSTQSTTMDKLYLKWLSGLNNYNQLHVLSWMHKFSFVHQALSLTGKMFSDIWQVNILVLLSRFLLFPLSHFVFAVLPFLCIFPGDFTDFLIDFSPELYYPGEPLCKSCFLLPLCTPMEDMGYLPLELCWLLAPAELHTDTQPPPPSPVWEVVLDFPFKLAGAVVRGNPVIWWGKD